MDVGDADQQAVDGFAHIRIEVDRVDDINLGVLLGNFHQGLADALETVAEVFPAVTGHEDDLAVQAQVREGFGSFCLEGRIFVQAGDYVQQCIDNGISGHDDGFRRDAFAQQIVTRRIGRGEVEVGQGTGQLAVGLFRPGRVEVAGT
ncbi:hypothetical protein D3C76_610020 [compost metagenome]